MDYYNIENIRNKNRAIVINMAHFVCVCVYDFYNIYFNL